MDRHGLDVMVPVMAVPERDEVFHPEHYEQHGERGQHGVPAGPGKYVFHRVRGLG